MVSNQSSRLGSHDFISSIRDHKLRYNGYANKKDTSAALRDLQPENRIEQSRYLSQQSNLEEEKFNTDKYSIPSKVNYVSLDEKSLTFSSQQLNLNERLVCRNESPSKNRAISKEFPFATNISLQHESKTKESIYEWVSLENVNVPRYNTNENKNEVSEIEVFMPIIDVEGRKITYPMSKEPIVRQCNMNDNHKLNINRELGETKEKCKFKKYFHQLKLNDEQRMFSNDNISKSLKHEKVKNCSKTDSLVKVEFPQVQKKFDETKYYFKVNTIQYTDKIKRNNLSILQEYQSKPKKEILLFSNKNISKSAKYEHKNIKSNKTRFVQSGYSTGSKKHEIRKNSSLEIGKNKTKNFSKETMVDKSILIYRYKILSPSSSGNDLQEDIGNANSSGENNVSECCRIFANTRKEIGFKERNVTKKDSIKVLKTSKDNARIKNIPLKCYRKIKRDTKIIITDEKPRRCSRKDTVTTENNISVKENKFSRKGLENIGRMRIIEENNPNDKITEITVGVINLADELSEDNSNITRKAKSINPCKQPKQKKIMLYKQLHSDNQTDSIMDRKPLHQISKKCISDFNCKRRIIPPINANKNCSTVSSWPLSIEEKNEMNMKTWIIQ